MPCRGSGQGGLQAPHPRGKLRGDLARGVSRPTLRGVCSWRGAWSRGEVPGPGGGGCVETPPGTATAAGSTHPTGMHSCYSLFAILTTHFSPLQRIKALITCHFFIK